MMGRDDRTEKPTPRRRQKARERGQVARSRELMGALATLAGILVVSWRAASWVGDWKELYRGVLDDAASGAPAFAARHGGAVICGVALVLGVTWCAAAAGAALQGGFVFAPSALEPNWQRMLPGEKLRRLLSWQAVAGLGKSMLPAGVLIYVAVAMVLRDWHLLPSLPVRSAASLLTFVAARIFEFGWKAALTMLVWAGFDYLLEWRRNEQELRMSRQELVEEFKETEGQPMIKARIRRLQRQVRRRRMLKDAERAAVVITNPTEFAIALEYRPEMAAPVVVAKGRNLLAQQIKQVALWHGIPMVENPPLAHALYRAVEIGQSIPPKLYVLVAEILAMLWRAEARAHSARAEAAR